MRLISEIKYKLKRYPFLTYSETKNSITIHTPDSEKGFDVGLYIDEDKQTAYTVVFGDWHGHFASEEEAAEFVAFGLSSECRVREISRGNRPYKWIVESFHDGEWVMSHESGSVFFPFWKQKVEKIYQNSVI